MSKVELAQRFGCSDSRVGRIERAEVDGSLRMSTMMRVADALESRLVYVVAPVSSLEDVVLRQTYEQALTEMSLPASLATDRTRLGPSTQDALEVRTLELLDTRRLWSKRRMPDPSPWWEL